MWIEAASRGISLCDLPMGGEEISKPGWVERSPRGGCQQLSRWSSSNRSEEHLFQLLIWELSSEYLACTLDHCVAHEKVQDDHLELQKRKYTQAETNKKNISLRIDGKSLSLFLPDNHDNEHWGRRNDLLEARKLLKREYEKNCLRWNSSHAQNNCCKSISFYQLGLLKSMQKT